MSSPLSSGSKGVWKILLSSKAFLRDIVKICDGIKNYRITCVFLSYPEKMLLFVPPFQGTASKC